jgi:hypothetical protein
LLRAQVLPLVRAETPDDPPPRLLVATRDSYVGNLGMLYGVESLRGGNVGLPNHHHPDLDLELSRDHLDLFGVHVVFRPGRGCQRYGRGLNLDIVHGDDDACVLRNPNPPRRYELLPSVSIVTSEEAMSELVASDPAGGVPVMTSHDDVAATASEQAAPGTISTTRYRPGAVELDVSTPSPRYLLVRESWLPGWSAEVDGRQTPVRRAAGMFFAVPVPAGRHVVELTYHHPGLALGLGGMAVWLVFAVFALRPRQRVRRT